MHRFIAWIKKDALRKEGDASGQHTDRAFRALVRLLALSAPPALRVCMACACIIYKYAEATAYHDT